MSIDWLHLDARETHDIPARVDDGLWTMVRTQVSAPALMRIEASGRWRVAPELPECGPDGLRHWAYGREGLLTRKAPLGALVGKFGGSGSAADETDVFVVGGLAVIQLEKASGPLYLTINGAPSCFSGHSGALTVLIR